MPEIVVSTCGTSLLTNGASESLRSQISANANAASKDAWQGDSKEFEEYAAIRKQQFMEMDLAGAARASAEMKALALYYAGREDKARLDTHILVGTDTYLGQLTVGWLSDYLERHWGIRAQSIRPTGLSTAERAKFQEGLKDLTRSLREFIYPAAGGERTSEVTFNLTGGFKSLNAYLQVVANLWADRTIFVFESMGELLVIPRLPLELDTSSIERNAAVARRLLCELKVTPQECKALPEIYYTEIEGECVISDIGTLLIREALDKIYTQKLLPPASPRVKYSPAFEKDFAGLAKQADRMRILQHRIDDFCRYVETGINPSSLQAKPLVGDSQYGYEFYAWSDGNAARVFYNEEGGIHTLEKLGKHL